MHSSLSAWLSRWWPLLFILTVAFCARTYRLTQPVLDWHSFRQADTISVTNEYLRNGIDLLRPRYQDLSSVQSGKPNPEGYRMVEFPLLNALTALSYIPVSSLVSIVTWSRLWSIAWSLGTIVCLYHLGVWLTGTQKSGLFAASCAAIMPFFIFYSQAVLPESALTFFFSFALLSFIWWVESKKIYWYIVSLLSLQMAVLLKPFVLFFVGPFATVVWFQWGLSALWQPGLYLYPLLCLVPFGLWRKWIEQFPQGIPAWEWLLNGTGIRFTPAWIRWLVWERLSKLWFGVIGILALPAAFITTDYRKLIFLSSWWAGGIVYVTLIATGNVTHDYYQVVLVPLVCLTAGVGVETALHLLTQFFKEQKNSLKDARTIAYLCIGLWAYMSWLAAWYYPLGGMTYFNINHPEYALAGEAVKRLTPPDALIIAPAIGGDTTLLWQTQRRGWPVALQNESNIVDAVQNKRALGATHFVTTGNDPDREVLKQYYQVLEETQEYIIFDLSRPLPEPSSSMP